MTNEIEQKEYETLAKQYIDNAKTIKEILMPGLKRKAIFTARRIALKIVNEMSLEYKGISRVYNCVIPDKLCANTCGLETCCKDCEVAILVKGK